MVEDGWGTSTLESLDMIKKKEVVLAARELTKDDYAQLLNELALEVESGVEAGGDCAVLLIKPEHGGRRPIVRTRSLIHYPGEDQEFLKDISKSLRVTKRWALWDIFG